ncbi:MAG TPA: lipase maturation factor family protein, partial [Flavitalea sp.]|nr:lipase maturation factor family protein [Flavitalea sp.]
RFMILRLLGFIYAIAFLVAINQILPLIGSNGLLPVGEYLERVKDALGSKTNGFLRLPSLFWFDHSDSSLLVAAWIGFLLSCLVAAGFANALVLAVLWFIYLSFVHVGQDWYGFGWEIQLTETGFLAIFLCPLLDMRPFPRAAPPLPVIYLFRWLTFRIMLGAGLIKIRGNTMWHDGTALFYHFETQPLPGPLSRWFHFLPHFLLKTGVWMNHLAELIAPWFVFWPRLARQIAGSVIIIFQVVLIISGNLSFLNWLTIVPTLACFDDRFWTRLLPRFLVRKAETAAAAAVISKPMITSSRVLAVVIGILSIQPVSNMLSSRQIMNTSFDPLDLVNTYGAFGTVEKERMNLVFEGTTDDEPNEQADWRPYIYKGLPVLPDNPSPQVAPYQLRLDWQLWFAAMSTSDEYPWTLNLVSKLLHNDPGALSLLAQNPFPDQPPKFIRVVRYHYSFAKPGNSKDLWWNRKRVDIWLEPLSTRDALIQPYNKHP